MEPSNRRSYYVQKGPDIQKTGASLLLPTMSLFSNCFMMKMEPEINDNFQEDLTIGGQRTEVVAFCDALRLLKETFCYTNEPSSDQVLCQLRRANALLAESLKKGLSLYSTDILQMAALVNSKIKGYFACTDLETKKMLSDVILCAIDKLSVAFNESLSGAAASSFGALHRTESFENLSLEQVLEQGRSSGSCLLGFGDGGEEVDEILLNVSSGVDKALQHAVSWLESARFIMMYIEKRSALELDLAKHLMKLATTSQQNIRCEKLPLQLAYHAAFTLDAELADGIHKFCTIIQTEKFLHPLSVRCAEHKKNCKDLKDLWSKEERQMREASENLRRSKSAYIARSRELMKTKEATQRAIADSNILNDAPALIRLEKRRKMEEEAVFKVTSAQEQYQRYVTFANDTKTQMNAAKKRILFDIRQLVDESDRILKTATIDYFALMAVRMTTIPLQFQALRKSSERYEPGSVYVQYAETLSASSSVPLQDEELVTFEPYSPTIEEIQEFRKRISPLQEVLPTELSQDPDSKRLLSEDDSDDESRSVSRSLDSSPILGRRHPVPSHRKLTSSSSFDGLADLDDDKHRFVKSGCRDFDEKGLMKSKVSHDFKRLRTIARCRQCDSYIYFNGFECSLCGLSCHKLCLRNLRWDCGHLKGRGSCRRSHSDRPLTVDPKGLPDRVPYVVKKCIEQIDASGLEVKGIFRVSAVKSRVETLCQKLESEDDMIDLSSESPHTIAGIMRLYLRQLDEPLIAFQLCEELVDLVKNSSQMENNLELIQQMKSVLSRLPGENFWTLSCLVHHLKRVAQFSEVNLMSASNLAVVFGPTLMRLSNGLVTTSSLADNKYQCNVVELLITHVEEIFGADPIPSNHLSSEDSLDSVSAENATAEDLSAAENVRSSVDGEGSCQPTTVWFDQNVCGLHQSTENMTIKSKQELGELPQNSSESDGSRTSNPATESISSCQLGTDNSAPLARDGVDSAESSDPSLLLCSPSFQRTRAYSPQFHRRIRPLAPVRRETFHCRKPRQMAPAVAKMSKSVSDDDI